MVDVLQLFFHRANQDLVQKALFVTDGNCSS